MEKSLIAITGASSGIGASMAKRFSEAGYPLLLMARNKDALKALQLPNCISASVDVRDFQQIQEAVDLAEKAFGSVDCLVNNAGFAKGGEFTQQTEQDHKTTVEVNVLGVIHGVEVVLPRMRARRHGTIINISSIADRNARPNIATYAATKAAVKNLTESLRMANASYGVRICNLAPAKIRTPMVITAGLGDNQIIEPEYVAEAALWMYQQPETVCIRDMVIAPTQYQK